jgi:hypothetical protein
VKLLVVEDDARLYVGYVRAKLAALGTPAVAIEAVRGVGFKLDVTT